QGNFAGRPFLAGGYGLGGGMRLSSQEPLNAWVVLLVAMYMPMFDRVLVELVTTLKSAMKLNCVPNTQFVSVLPVAGSLTLLTSAIRTSLAVQFNALLWAVLVAGRPAATLYSFCRQVFAACADAGAGVMASASSATATRTDHFDVIHRNRGN